MLVVSNDDSSESVTDDVTQANPRRFSDEIKCGLTRTHLFTSFVPSPNGVSLLVCKAVAQTNENKTKKHAGPRCKRIAAFLYCDIVVAPYTLKLNLVTARTAPHRPDVNKLHV